MLGGRLIEVDAGPEGAAAAGTQAPLQAARRHSQPAAMPSVSSVTGTSTRACWRQPMRIPSLSRDSIRRLFRGKPVARAAKRSAVLCVLKFVGYDARRYSARRTAG